MMSIKAEQGETLLKNEVRATEKGGRDHGREWHRKPWKAHFENVVVRLGNRNSFLSYSDEREEDTTFSPHKGKEKIQSTEGRIYFYPRQLEKKGVPRKVARRVNQSEHQYEEKGKDKARRSWRGSAELVK